jgi:hypothetical protein
MKKKIIKKKPKRKIIKKLPAKKTSKLTLSSPVIQKLNKLSQQLGKIFPASSFYSGSLSFEKLAKDYGFSKYWPKKGNKDVKMSAFLKKIYKNHKRMLIKIIRENLPQGITRRHGQGNAVLKVEVLYLDITLRELTIKL